MTVLEFVSHLGWGVSVHITDISTNCHASVRAEVLETESYSGWHDSIVVGWEFSMSGVCYLEVKTDV